MLFLFFFIVKLFGYHVIRLVPKSLALYTHRLIVERKNKVMSN